MYCTECGKQVPDQDSFCMHCGKPLRKMSGTPVAPAAPGTTGAPVAPVAPVTPVAPVVPVTPVAPVAPVVPVTPVTPVAPGVPGTSGAPGPRTGHKSRTGLTIALVAGSLFLVAAVFFFFICLLPWLNSNSSNRERPTTIQTTDAEDASVVGIWANEDLPGVVKFKSNGNVYLYSDDSSDSSTYEYDEEKEEGTIFLDTGDLVFSVSGETLDIRGIGEFERVEDKDFDIQNFMEDNSTLDVTAPDMTTESTTTKTDTSGGKVTIGVAMPTDEYQRWYSDGINLKTELEAAGFAVDLQYAGSDPETQVSQIETMIDNGASVLVVAAVDGSSLSTVLAEAKEKNIQVIAFDRLIYYTDAVSYYVTFDNYKLGTMQGQYVIDALELDTAEGPFNIEFFAGAPDDYNADDYFNGQYDILEPYIESGKLVVVSGQSDFESVATAAWKAENAAARMESLLASYYSDGTKLDAVLCSNDTTALGVEYSLEAAGYEAGANWPVITGQDCDLDNIRNMIAGKQSMSAFKDTRTLCTKTVEMVAAIVSGTEVPVNNTSLYDNGEGIVPAFLCDAIYADKDNYREVLIDSGYYLESELG